MGKKGKRNSTFQASYIQIKYPINQTRYVQRKHPTATNEKDWLLQLSFSDIQLLWVIIVWYSDHKIWIFQTFWIGSRSLQVIYA